MKYNIKKLLTILFLFVAIVPSFRVVAQESDTYFPYPVVPEEKVTLAERCNYLVEHFWDRCNFKQSFSSLDKLSQAFGDWLSFMPYASADTVHMSINHFIGEVGKIGGENTAAIAGMAESWLYSDSAMYTSEELYLPFAKAAAMHKKVNKALKTKYAMQVKMIENSSVGAIMSPFDYIKSDGLQGNFADAVASRVILLFYNPDCIDCSLAKARLGADYNLNKLIEEGLVKVVAIYPGEITDEWKENALTLPDSWIVGAAPDIDMEVDIPETPCIYYLDARHKILAKHVVIDNLLLGIQKVYQQMHQ